MFEPEILKLVPPLTAIILAIITRKVYSSLLIGILLGGIIIKKDFLYGTLYVTEIISGVFSSSGNTKVILFTLLIGVLIIQMQKSGGTAAFINLLERKLFKDSSADSKKNKILLNLSAAILGSVIFIETNVSLLTCGTTFRPAFDKFKISRDRLAYIADTSSSPICILVPFNAWGAFVLGLIALEGFSNPFEIFLKSIPLNFYPIFALLLMYLLIITNKDFGTMKKSKHTEEHETNEGNKDPNSSKGKLRNFFIPIFALMGSMPIFLILSGHDSLLNIFGKTAAEIIFEGIKNGSGSTAVLHSVIIALLTAFLLHNRDRTIKKKATGRIILKGISDMLPMAFIMLLAFAIGDVSRELGTGTYLSGIVVGKIPEFLFPLIVFLISALISFSTGTSWGTFGIMIPIIFPVAQSLGLDFSLVLAAVLGGGVFGDHASPISDTTIIASMASGTDHISHVRTQLPYALTAALLSAVSFTIAGFLF